MEEVVHSNLHSKLFGKGLPEQMRSTAFVFLGLTAAGALTLVAIFAQLSFPLLSPVPLPAGPGGESGVSDGVSLAGERVAPLRRAVSASAAPRPAAPEARESAGTPEVAATPASGGGTRVSHPTGGGVTPTPSPAAPSKPAPPSSAPPVDPPQQTPPAAAPEPLPTPKPTPAADPAPAPPPAPVPPLPAAQPPAAPAAAAASPPAHSNAGGNGKGNAYGHAK